jgi:hypothetical protein
MDPYGSTLGFLDFLNIIQKTLEVENYDVWKDTEKSPPQMQPQEAEDRNIVVNLYSLLYIYYKEKGKLQKVAIVMFFRDVHYVFEETHERLKT